MDRQKDLREVGLGGVPLLSGVPAMPGAQETQAHLPICVKVRVKPETQRVKDQFEYVAFEDGHTTECALYGLGHAHDMTRS